MQRTAIARALVHRPKLLLADEPTGNLDGANADKVLKIFRRVADEHLTTLVVITHSSEVAEIAQRRIHLRDGRAECVGGSACEERIGGSAGRRVGE
jgi:ABC-type lipoprotein export system ATPase subunit